MELSTEFLLEVKASVAVAYEVGETPYGRRRVIPITGGTFEGPRLSGNVVPGGADWQVVRSDGVFELMALYELETADGVLVHVTSRGLRHGPPEVLERLARGEDDVDPSLYYFRSHVTLEAPAGSYDWLNRSLYVAAGARHSRGVQLRFYRVL